MFAYKTSVNLHTITKRKGVCEMSQGGYGYHSNFALIVVLFILLIIVGAAFLC